MLVYQKVIIQTRHYQISVSLVSWLTGEFRPRRCFSNERGQIGCIVGGGFKYFFYCPLPGEIFQFDHMIFFQMG